MYALFVYGEFRTLKSVKTAFLLKKDLDCYPFSAVVKQIKILKMDFNWNKE